MKRILPISIPRPPQPPGWVPWPSDLPECANTWSETTQDPRVRTSMEVGRPKTRRRYTGIMRKVNVTMILSNNEGGINEKVISLRSFYEGSGDGAAHIGGCDAGYIYFRFRSPVDDVEHYYRFVTPPVFTNNGPLSFTVSMEWEEL